MDIDFPFRIGADGRTLSSPSHAQHVRDMIELVLFTQPGERAMRPDFGAGLLHYVFGPNRPDQAPTLQASIHGQLAQWLGDLIELRDVQVVSEDGALRATVSYVLRASGAQTTETFLRSST